MREPGLFLGIDVGTVSVSVVGIDRSRHIVIRATAAHNGRVRETLSAVLGDEVLGLVRRAAATSSTPAFVARSSTIDPIVAGVTAARFLHGKVRALLLVGGERLSMTRLDEGGEYSDTRTNSSCAAGTGSFLDQQARVLGLGDGATLAATALRAHGPVPRIASRCAVFARTDLIHAQQEGYGLAEIADALCQGLSSIVADTLTDGEPIAGPVVFAGGVALNAAVRAHLERRLGTRLLVDDHAPFYGALGAALRLLEEDEERDAPPLRLSSVADLVGAADEVRRDFHEPLDVRPSDPPDIGRARRYVYAPRAVDVVDPVEVEVDERVTADANIEVFMGIDVGSTSTKAAVLDTGGGVLVGVYTRTAGRPVEATQALFEAVHAWCRDAGVTLRVLGAGTTGSGRKLIGTVIGADLVVDEITAHARAAFELDPRTDTIIEIGGQDAKFTTLRNGRVTSAVMNTVCAAGTGSFIEEQARQLGVALESYADEVAGARAPLASDRCTVFMQRDVNHLLACGHTRGEVLSSVLRSTCENYLQKVAREGSIGRHVCFQGATARNRALVAAFEQRLGRPIRVSRYCHLTGALGVAHLLRETAAAASSFRGFELFAERIPLSHEVCELCRNHCKIVLANVRGEVAAYGFLCGRDYDVDRFVSRNRSGFDLLRTRRRIIRCRPARTPRSEVTLGLPAALHLFEDLELWRSFFRRLGVRVVTSEACEDPVGTGKRLEHAEFCAPVAAWHGHIDHLLERADHVFAPVYLESRDPGRGPRRQFCYTTQFASALTRTPEGSARRGKILRPLITPGMGNIQTNLQLHAALKTVMDRPPSFRQVASAYTDALELIHESRERLREAMRRELARHDDIAVVLLGRPYVCLDPRMNKGIPDVLGALGVKTFFQDMLAMDGEDLAPIAGLLDQVHWTHGARILEAAFVVARTPRLYPVLLTAFKCAPDSFILEFFRRILDTEGKPYLVLELDEHDSCVGYETRLEAAVRSFRNHRPSLALPNAPPVVPEVTRELEGRRLYIPAWDRLSCELVAANLRREGVDARVLPETELTVRKSLRCNSGQCIPVHAIVEGFADAVHTDGLDPGRTALWMAESRVACNIGMYPQAIKAMLQARGGGLEHAAVYVGDISFLEVSVRAAINTYFAFMLGGMLRRMACRVRPYEVTPGEADFATGAGMAIFTAAFENGRDRRDAVREVVDLFAAIETRSRDRPKVAIFGDLYVRDNEVMNQDLVRFIERHGGEVITTPYSEYVKIVAKAHFQRWFREGKLQSVVLNRSLLATVTWLERQLLGEFARVLDPVSFARPGRSPRELLTPFAVTNRHTGESLDNLLKVFHILESYPDVSLFVQANPAFCCPSLVTEAMAGRIQQRTGVPIVTVCYDGTAVPHNEAIVPYLAFAARRRRAARPLAVTGAGRRPVVPGGVVPP